MTWTGILIGGAILILIIPTLIVGIGVWLFIREYGEVGDPTWERSDRDHDYEQE